MSLAYVPATGREPRFWKYVFLISTSVLIVWMIFVAYANYAFRREIDDKIRQVAPDETIETIIYKIGNSKETLEEIKQWRCAQRDMIAYYRWASMSSRADLSRLYDITYDAREQVKRYLSQQDEVDKEVLPKLLSSTWGMVRSDEVPLKVGLSDWQRASFTLGFQRVLAETNGRIRSRAQDAFGGTSLFDRADFRQFKNGLMDFDTRVFETTGIDAIEKKLNALEKAVRRDEATFAAFERLSIMKLMAESAFSNAPDRGIEQVRDKIGDPRTLGTALGALDCAHNDRQTLDYVVQRITAAAESFSRDRSKTEISELEARNREQVLKDFTSHIAGKPVWGHSPTSEPGQAFFERPLSAFLALPTSMQALAVTILFGMLGGQTVNLLRLSRVGYWGTQPEPDWSDIAAVPILGGIAALAIYLLTAMGIVVGTEGRAGVGQLNTIGAALVGFLAFISGLLNQEAFARVQAVGQRLLSAEPQAIGIALTKVDQDLSDQLEALDRRLMADLVRRHGLGTYLDDPARKDHALLLPSDDWFEGRTAKDWFDLAGVSGRRKVLALVDQLLIKDRVVPAELPTVKDLGAADNRRYLVSVTVDNNRTVAKIGDAQLQSFTPTRWRSLDLIPVDGPPAPGAV